ncbi:putative potassium transporter 12 [Wolffia australiana]
MWGTSLLCPLLSEASSSSLPSPISSRELTLYNNDAVISLQDAISLFCYLLLEEFQAIEEAHQLRLEISIDFGQGRGYMASLGTNNESGGGGMWDLERKLDQPMEEEAERLNNVYTEKKFSILLILRLAYQSLGVVFGDLGTSPLYVFYNVFPDGVEDDEEVVGALSLIIYTLTLIPLIKYILVVLRANDNGQGGTLALYSLLCRHANVKTIPNLHRTDEALTTYSRRTFEDHSLAAKIKKYLEANAYKKNVLLVLALIGTCMTIGDGILTPAISVLSAAGGIKVDHPRMSSDVVVVVASVILVGLFCLQRYGADRVGWLFAPIVLVWFILIGAIGLFNLLKYDTSVLRAFSPVFIVRYFRKGRHSWASLGGILLCVTGTEAMFADLSNFPVLAVQIAFIGVVFPCLLLAYAGQAAYIVENNGHAADAFYRSIPGGVYWPMFIVATAAAVVASQAAISATFSIVKQALALGCFPRVKVVHTSKNFMGQIYIPDINWVLMILCIAVTVGFKNQTQIGNAYGTAVMIVMLVTTLMMIPIMLLVWQSHWILVSLFTFLSLLIELTYLSAVLLKIDQGGWVPLAVAAAFLAVMAIWHYGAVQRYDYELHSRVSMGWIVRLGPSLGLVRVPGIGFVYTELASGVPHIFSHLITNLPAIHSVVVFVCVKYLPLHTVPAGERFLVKRIGPKSFSMFRCIARYGYGDLHRRDDDFESMLFDSLSLFVRLEAMMEACSEASEYSSVCRTNVAELEESIAVVEEVEEEEEEEDELEYLKKCRDSGVVHIMGNTVIRTRKGSGLVKKVAIDYLYAFLRKVCRENSVIFQVPHESLLNVGQVFYV